MSSDIKEDVQVAANAVDVVSEFLNSLGPTSEAFWRTFDVFFDELTIWENVGVARTVGREEAIAFSRTFPVKFDHMRVEDLVLSGFGDRVFAERLDHFCTHDGAIVLT
ncbi:limonene-1,2-epoxide hydrolase family protein, partial [Stenotrophomonas maltophilia]|uniref:limonene-1,2-epoxide hydrolase family protein n=2 Tax=Lysobacteraceae TaxID=32033 RepID=UPI00066E31D4